MRRIKKMLVANYSLYRLGGAIYYEVIKIRNLHKGKKQYSKNKAKYKALLTDSSFQVDKHYEYPCYLDRFEDAGNLGTYFWQDLWAARLIHENSPQNHYDIGSRVDGFIGHLASFREGVVLIDIRHLQDVIPGVSFVQDDATNLRSFSDDSIESISALCSIEHFGLGRYGDEVDPDAWKKVISAIKRVLCVGGHAYIAVPIGRQHVEYDAHRVFYASTIIEAFAPLKLIEFSCIYARDERIERNVPIHKYDNDLEKGDVRFGLFHFVKEEL